MTGDKFVLSPDKVLHSRPAVLVTIEPIGTLLAILPVTSITSTDPNCKSTIPFVSSAPLVLLILNAALTSMLPSIKAVTPVAINSAGIGSLMFRSKASVVLSPVCEMLILYVAASPASPVVSPGLGTDTLFCIASIGSSIFTTEGVFTTSSGTSTVVPPNTQVALAVFSNKLCAPFTPTLAGTSSTNRRIFTLSTLLFRILSPTVITSPKSIRMPSPFRPPLAGANRLVDPL